MSILSVYLSIQELLPGDTHCNTLQHTVTHCNTMRHTVTLFLYVCPFCVCISQYKTRCFTLHCNTLQNTAKHCNTLQHTAKTHFKTLQHIILVCLYRSESIFISIYDYVCTYPPISIFPCMHLCV